MMTNANPGLSRRFQWPEKPFVFSDYDDESLTTILLKMAKDKKIKLTIPTAIIAVEKLAKAKASAHFGNAGAVANSFASAMEKMISRDTRAIELLPVDFASEEDSRIRSIETILADLVGCDDVYQKLREYRNVVNLAKSTGREPNVQYNFLFVGSPGTGKTTVARKMGQAFYSLGLLPTDDVVEMKAADLQTGFLGQAGITTKKALYAAKGKVLFIDEAYELNPKRVSLCGMWCGALMLILLMNAICIDIVMGVLV